jgi:hypothetical protein
MHLRPLRGTRQPREVHVFGFVCSTSTGGLRAADPGFPGPGSTCFFGPTERPWCCGGEPWRGLWTLACGLKLTNCGI